jgi:putative ABC transport system permease protein
MEILLSDVRYALRTWLRSPGFVIVAVLTLALGIGANTTIFSVVDATLLAQPPYPEPQRLVTLWKGAIDDPDNLNITSMPNFKDWRAQTQSFEDIAIFDSAGRGYALTEGDAEMVSGVRVTASFFSVLGVQPMLGRTFRPEEEEPGRDRVVILSHGLWMRRFTADRAIVGKTIQIDGMGYTVVGVMPREFNFQFWSGPRQLWVPAGWTKGDYDRGSNSFLSIGRLKRGVTLAQARTEMDVIGRGLAKLYVDANSGNTIRLIPLAEVGSAGVRATLYALLGVVGFVLLIACVNIANLLLARAATRSREMAIRRALGAGRARLVRQMLTESVLLAVAGGACGVLLAALSMRVFVRILPGYFMRLPGRPFGEDAIGLNVMVLLFTFGVTMLSGVLFGLAPAIASFRTKDLNSPLKENARGSTSGKSRLRYGLVASEVALTLVVLAGAGLMIASVYRLLDVAPGLDPKNVVIMGMSLPQENLYYGPPGNPRFCEDLDQNVGSLPGVVSVSGIGHLPLGGGNAGRGVTFEGRPDPGPDKQAGGNYSVACPNILKTLGIPLIAGREFTFRDTVAAPGVVLINEAFAKRFFPKEDPVGKRFKIGSFSTDAPWLTIVGVFKNVRHNGLDIDPRPQFYRPYSQAGWPFFTIVTKTIGAPATFIEPVKSALHKMEPNHPAEGAKTMEQIIGGSVSDRRFMMMLLSIFAGLALVLAAVGIAGVVGYSVIQRTQEIGVRIALGAQARDVLRLVLGHSLGWTLFGVAVGVVASLGLLKMLKALLFGVTASDPLVLGGVSVLLVGVALLASYVPARRAMRVDPVSALRGE